MAFLGLQVLLVGLCASPVGQFKPHCSHLQLRKWQCRMVRSEVESQQVPCSIKGVGTPFPDCHGRGLVSCTPLL